MKDPIRIFIDTWNDIYCDVPWTTWTWVAMAWIFAAAMIILTGEGII